MDVNAEIVRMKARGSSCQDIYIYVKDYIEFEQFSHLYQEALYELKLYSVYARLLWPQWYL